MKRNVIAAIVAVVVFGGTFAFADTLGTLTTGTVGDSAVVVGACNSGGGAAVAFGAPAWDATNKRYGVSSLTGSGLTSSCNTDNVRVTLTGSGGASLGEGTGTVATGSVTVNFATPVQAAAVLGAEVVVTS